MVFSRLFSYENASLPTTIRCGVWYMCWTEYEINSTWKERKKKKKWIWKEEQNFLVEAFVLKENQIRIWLILNATRKNNEQKLVLRAKISKERGINIFF